MNKIPVGATIAHAYRFAFNGVIDLVRLSWLPILGMVAGFFLVVPTLSAMMRGIANQDPAIGGPQILTVLLSYIAIIILAFVQITAVGQAALGIRSGKGWVNFPLGAPLWRLIGAFLLFILAYLLIAIAWIVIAAIIGGITGVIVATTGSSMNVAMTIIRPVVTILSYAVFLTVFIRLGYFLTPVVLQEDKISLRRAWKLSKGNFWRLFAVIIATTLPFLVVEVGLFLTFFHLPPLGAVGGSGQTGAAILSWEADMFSGLAKGWYISMPVFAVYMILFYGLFVSAQAFAYRAVTQPDAEGPWA